MKRFMAILGLVVLLAPASTSLARGNHRSAIDRKWAQVEIVQKNQNERFKKLEREADKAINSLENRSGSHASPNQIDR